MADKEKTPIQLEAEKYIELANLSAKQRLEAPPTEVKAGDIRIPSKEKRDRVMKAKYGGHVKRLGKKKKGRYGFFAPFRDIRSYAEKGCQPELEDGDFVRNEGDILYSCPTKLYEMGLLQNKAISDRTLMGATKKAKGNGKLDPTVDHSAQVAVVGPEK